jgi:hypothetical protein
MMDFLSILGANAVVPMADSAWHDEVPARLLRRDPRIWHMAYVAAARLLKTTVRRPKALSVGTALGALDETRNFLDGIYGDGFGSPRHFIASVHNSMAGKLALEFSIDGPNLTLCDGQNSFASAIAACATLSSAQFPVLVVGADEHIPLLNDIIPRLSASCADFLTDHRNEGAVALLLDKNNGEPSSRVRAQGPVFIGGKEIANLTDSLLETTSPGAMVVPPGANRSFVAAALSVWECVKNARPGKTIVGSYSPSSRACAAIEILQ